MSAMILDGRGISKEIREEMSQRVEQMKSEGIQPGLAVILVGDNPASKIYVRDKARACTAVGIASRVIRMPQETTQQELLDVIAEINADDAMHGLLVQLPLPKHIDESAVLRAIDPKKDVDAFHAQNTGALFNGHPVFLPCTPKGCIELIRRAGARMEGAQAVVVGRSNIVGKPMALLLLGENATVTICHSRTRNLKEICRTADILVVAIGKAKFITGDMIKPGATVIDVGMNRDENGKLCGDVDFEAASEIAGAITPVPGGVGPMTITMLLSNTLEAAQRYAN